ncbi:MAG: haloacid dehalogenase-like hydrolase, partial [Candidatus Competibacteraceae bacterium]|nr:haloacid dehalogenase-like hydrolase [Candidatus Competibacteraceae bacterium]
ASAGPRLAGGRAPGAARRPPAARVLDLELDWQRLDTAGATDLAIAARICRQAGRSERWAQSLIRAYLAELPGRMAERPAQPLPNVPPLLAALSHQAHYHCLLLTGNVQAAARIKLASCALADTIQEGGFGDAGLERRQVAQQALRLARRVGGKGVRVLVIGDTPRDINCARHIKAQVLAVATGRFSRRQLAAFRPDGLVEVLPAGAEFFDLVAALLEDQGQPGSVSPA